MPITKIDTISEEEIELSLTENFIRSNDFQILNLTEKMKEFNEKFPDYQEIFLMIKPILNPTDRSGTSFNPFFNRAKLIFKGIKKSNAR